LKKININCVDLVRKIRDSLYLETKEMTKEELIEFYSPEKRTDLKSKKKSKLKAA